MAISHKTVITDEIFENFPLASGFMSSEVKNKDLLLVTLLEATFKYFLTTGMRVPETTSEIRTMCQLIPYVINAPQPVTQPMVRTNRKPLKKAKRKNTSNENFENVSDSNEEVESPSLDMTTAKPIQVKKSEPVVRQPQNNTKKAESQNVNQRILKQEVVKPESKPEPTPQVVEKEEPQAEVHESITAAPRSADIPPFMQEILDMDDDDDDNIMYSSESYTSTEYQDY